jgi:hypothetical protein
MQLTIETEIKLMKIASTVALQTSIKYKAQ